MVKVSVADIQKLREITGAGMMDCKKALEEAGGDFEGAQDWLRKKGIAKAAKREDREAKEGVVIAIANADQTRGVIVALNCETDFVARNDNFVELTGKMADLALSNFPDSLEALLSLPFEGSVSIAEKVGEQNGVIGEKIELSRYERIEGAQVLTYNHSNNKRSVLVALNKAGHDDAGRNVAMQIAAMSPVSVGKDDVDPKIIEKEIEIGKELARNEGKPEDMLEKISLGRLNKFFQESTLLSQKYVKGAGETVEQYLSGLEKGLTVTGFKHVAL
ncbi:MAG: elongation factor Ts [Saprospiraceae bacterium]|nr:elongation factor Ts [Saprospiraceae bacterium]MCB0545163.1 elongation factor Ts [Saprospiraceae bacterium]MCB0575275.1 elongation factor Ts [Saprospiraceae bacterium]